MEEKNLGLVHGRLSSYLWGKPKTDSGCSTTSLRNDPGISGHLVGSFWSPPDSGPADKEEVKS